MASEELIDKVWDKADEIRGKNPDLYRKDAYGNPIFRHSYGKNTEMGWQIDHIKAVAQGGSDNMRNLQALKSSINQSKGDSLKKKSRHSQH